MDASGILHLLFPELQANDLRKEYGFYAKKEIRSREEKAQTDEVSKTAATVKAMGETAPVGATSSAATGAVKASTTSSAASPSPSSAESDIDSKVVQDYPRSSHRASKTSAGAVTSHSTTITQYADTGSPIATSSFAEGRAARLGKHSPNSRTSRSAARGTVTKLPSDGAFDRARADVERDFIGQRPYITSLFSALRRPSLTGFDERGTRSVILIVGGHASGRHFSLELALDALKEHKALETGGLSRIDLASYTGDERGQALFLADLYGALAAPTAAVAFSNFEKASTACLAVVQELAVHGSYRLGSRYAVQNGMLVEVTGALVKDAIDTLHMSGKYLVLIAEGEGGLSKTFNGTFLDRIDDVVRIGSYSDADVRVYAERGLSTLTDKCSQNLRLSVHADDLTLGYVCAAYSPAEGFAAIDECINESLFRPLSDLVLDGSVERGGVCTLTVADGVPELESQGRRYPLHRGRAVRAVDLAEIKTELDGLVGMQPLKDYLAALERNLEAQAMRRAAGRKVTPISMHMVFTGNPGTGKTTAARVVARYLKALGVLSGGQLREVARADLVGEYAGHTAVKTKAVIDSALGGVLFIDEAYSLTRNAGDAFGLEAVDALVKGIEDNRDDLVVIIAGYTNEMRGFLDANPGLRSRFPNTVNFPDYTAEEMLAIAQVTARSKGYRIEPDCDEGLSDLFAAAQLPSKDDSGNGRLVRNVVEHAVLAQSKRILADPTADMDALTRADFGLDAAQRRDAFDLEAELSEIIGMDEVKRFVRALAARIRVDNARREHGLPVASAGTLHMVFTGNPGTGKTMMARTVARTLHALGAIRTDTLIETDRAGLVAGYVGQTAMKTSEVMMGAMDGVLFIDEAYTLSSGGPNDFGREAIDTLVKLMDDYRDRLVVILAGYTADMERFLQTNPGLKSRFPNVVEFPDYSTAELMEIARGFYRRGGYQLSGTAEARLETVLDHARRRPDFGNGRYVRNVYERSLNNQALRLSSDADLSYEDVTIIEAADIEEVE